MAQFFRLLFERGNCAANLTIVLLLSFGLGAAALLAASLDRFLMHPLHVPHPETLVRTVERHPPVTNTDWFPYHMYEAMRSMHTLRDIAIEGSFDTAVSLRTGTQSEVQRWPAPLAVSARPLSAPPSTPAAHAC